MNEIEKLEAQAEISAKYKSLVLLFEYTKFHIGLYLTLTAAYLGAATATISGSTLFDLTEIFVIIAVVAIVLAGMCAGVIASSITQTKSRSTEEFLKTQIGPTGLTHFNNHAGWWVCWEHRLFWVGLISAVVSFAE